MTHLIFLQLSSWFLCKYIGHTLGQGFLIPAPTQHIVRAYLRHPTFKICINEAHNPDLLTTSFMHYRSTVVRTERRGALYGADRAAGNS